MFLDVVSITNSLRLWDYMLVRGALPAVVEVTLSILSLIESEIKHNPDELRIYEILTSNLNVSAHVHIEPRFRAGRLQSQVQVPSDIE
jgi:hypothetical protein